MLPNFLVIGAQRSGSTWLYRALKQHPDVYMPETKELEFFSYTKRHTELGLRRYSRRHFSDVATETAIGEATPSYLWTSEAHPRWCKKPPGFESDIPGVVRESLGPDVKLIASLRNPVERAVSGFLHHARRGRISPTRSILDIGRHGGIVHIGFYHAHLTEWLRVFDRSNLLILLFDDIVNQPAATFERVSRFLEVDPTFRPDRLGAAANPGLKWSFRNGTYVSDQRVEVATQEGVLGRGESVVTAEQLEALREIYRGDVSRLARDFQLDVGHWLDGAGAL